MRIFAAGKTSFVVQLIPNEHDYQKQSFTNVLQTLLFINNQKFEQYLKYSNKSRILNNPLQEQAKTLSFHRKLRLVLDLSVKKYILHTLGVPVTNNGDV